MGVLGLSRLNLITELLGPSIDEARRVKGLYQLYLDGGGRGRRRAGCGGMMWLRLTFEL